MTICAADPCAQELHERNARLCELLDHLETPPASPPRVILPWEMADLLSVLMQAGECLRTSTDRMSPELERERGAYRKSVERLRDLLPAIHATLLAERARLEQERARVQTAAAWATRSRETLR